MNTGQKILVIDDDKSVLRTFTLILKKDDYDVDIAETGKEALEKAGARAYDAALIETILETSEKRWEAYDKAMDGVFNAMAKEPKGEKA